MAHYRLLGFALELDGRRDVGLMVWDHEFESVSLQR
jgi:hypothetical protein